MAKTAQNHREGVYEQNTNLSTFGVLAITGLVAQGQNFLLLTADDLSWGDVGFNGNPIPDITPHLDRLAERAIVVEHAYVPTSVCMPVRHSLMTGRYPATAGDFGDFHPIDADVPTLPEILKERGYRTGVIGKAWHMWLPEKFDWDYYVGGGHTPRAVDGLATGRSPSLYKEHVRRFLAEARANDQPFFLNVNSHDPHRLGEDWIEMQPNHPKQAEIPITAIYDPNSVPVPGFLPDLPEVREELAYYYAAVNRMDAVMGAVFEALEEAGHSDDTVVIFLSDHGMPFWLAKQDIYRHGTRVPWIMYWPGHTPKGMRDTVSMINAVDYSPTILDILGIEGFEDMHGKSFKSILQGRPDPDRDHVFVMRNGGYKISRPMAGVITRTGQYIFNPWSVTGEMSMEGSLYPSYGAIRAAAEYDPTVRRLLRQFDFRPLEEFYDLTLDPLQICNRIDDPAYGASIQELRDLTIRYTRKYLPGMAKALEAREDSEELKAFIESYTAERAAVFEAGIEMIRAYTEAGGMGTVHQPVGCQSRDQ